MTQLTSKDLLVALRKRYADNRHWIYGEEVRLGTGYDHAARHTFERDAEGRWHKKLNRTTVEQRIDAFVMSCFGGESYRKIAFEIKISRSDFLREIADPVKRAGALAVSNKFYFLTPPKLVKASEIPDECGLMEVRDGDLRVVKPAPDRKCAEPTWSFIASFIRNCANGAIEQHLELTRPLREADEECHAKQVARLEAEVKRLKADLRLCTLIVDMESTGQGS
jgi:hypothetical protein